ncbi:Unknown protein sequence [Pseudomonas syringae pv. maculicola]|nr:Unknown protein sequence [Pseudomonas syringae pv. maculicola]
MGARMQTAAEKHLNDSTQTLATVAIRIERGEGAVLRQFHFADGSTLHVRRLSGRSAYGASGRHLADSK